MTLGQRISIYRKKPGISQETLGERLGVSRQAVSKWETDAASPDMENLLALAREFGVSVAELTETPEVQDGPMDTPTVSPIRGGWWAALGAFVAVILVMIGVVIYWCVHANDGQISKTPEPPDATATSPSVYAGSDFALMWPSDVDGFDYALELGMQGSFFPFGTDLELTAPEEILGTDFHLTELHKTICGSINLDYLHIGADPEVNPESPEQETIICLSTISKNVHTPRGIHVGSTKAEVTAAYGDDLVYCLKEEGGYTLVQHDYYYAYQTQETFGASLQIFMRDGIVAGLRVEDMAEDGNLAFLPDNIRRFPVISGEPDFSQRVEPEYEERSDTWQVYHAWNELVANNNLSAEEAYTHRWTVFSGLSDLDWQEFGSLGTTEYPEQTVEAFLSWLWDQAPYSGPETLRLQMGVQSNLDGWLTESYTGLLSRAFFQDPVTFAKKLATDSLEDCMSQVVALTAHDAIWCETDCRQSIETLEAALSDGTFTETQAGWCRLLLLYLTTETEASSFEGLPRTPADMQ